MKFKVSDKVKVVKATVKFKEPYLNRTFEIKRLDERKEFAIKYEIEVD